MNPQKRDDAVVKTNPDPTEAVKEALELAIKNLDDKIDLRLKGMEQATALARDDQKEKLTALKQTLENAAAEKASSNKDLVEKLEKANQVALTAALQTQKESAAKSELSMADLLKQLQVSFETANKATNEKIDRLTSRLDTGEGRTGGAIDNRQISRQDVEDTRRGAESTRTFMMALIGVLVAATAIIVTVLMRGK